MSFILLGILNSQAIASVSYWLAALGDSGFDQANSVVIDSTGNAILSGSTQSGGAGGTDALFASFDGAGAVQWQRSLGGSGTDQSQSTALDSSNNFYATGIQNSEGAGGFEVLIAKYNSSGTIQWQRTLGGSGDDRAESIAIDSSDNLYVVGQNDLGSTINALISKYNSSGTIQWQRSLGGVGTEKANGVVIDSSDNVYVTGRQTSEGEGNSDFFIAKYNSSGTLEWQRMLGGTGFDAGNSVATNSSGDVFITGFTFSEGQGSADVLLVKYNSSGTLQWQRILGGTDNDRGYSISLDSSGNIYLAGINASEGEGAEDALLAKYDSSGTIQWQRTLGGVGFDAANSVKIDSRGDLYFAGYLRITADSTSDVLLAKLPSDGSLTGSYTINGESVVYAASTLTAATSTLTSATSTLTAATSTLTSATSTLTDSTSSFSSYLVEL